MANIQPIWAIDEYAMIFRIWVWLSPPHAPMKIDKVAISKIIVWSRRL